MSPENKQGMIFLPEEPLPDTPAEKYYKRVFTWVGAVAVGVGVLLVNPPIGGVAVFGAYCGFLIDYKKYKDASKQDGLKEAEPLLP
jgi:hypothetical protein